MFLFQEFNAKKSRTGGDTYLFYLSKELIYESIKNLIYIYISLVIILIKLFKIIANWDRDTSWKYITTKMSIEHL